MRILLVMERGEPGMGWACERALRDLGHEVFLEDNRANLLPLGGANVWSYGRTAQRLRARRINDVLVNRAVRRRAGEFDPDFILLAKGENLRVETVRWLRTHTRAVLGNWNLDNPFRPENTSLDHLHAMPYLHFYGAFARHFVPVLESLGCPRVVHLPCYYSPAAHPLDVPVEVGEAETYGCDVLFAGNWSPEREAALLAIADLRLSIWGWLWERLPMDSPLRARYRGRGVVGRDYVRALRGASIVVNVLNEQGKGANNLRTFEATGLGRLLVTEHSEEHAGLLFEEDREVVCFRSPAELREKVLHYLAHPEERGRIAAAGQRRTLREHTLDVRLQRLLEVVEEVRATIEAR